MIAWHPSQVPELHLCCLCLIHTTLLRATVVSREKDISFLNLQAVDNRESCCCLASTIFKHMKQLITVQIFKAEKSRALIRKAIFFLQSRGRVWPYLTWSQVIAYVCISSLWTYAVIGDDWHVYVQIPVAPVAAIFWAFSIFSKSYPHQ